MTEVISASKKVEYPPLRWYEYAGVKSGVEQRKNKEVFPEPLQKIFVVGRCTYGHQILPIRRRRNYQRMDLRKELGRAGVLARQGQHKFSRFASKQRWRAKNEWLVNYRESHAPI